MKNLFSGTVTGIFVASAAGPFASAEESLPGLEPAFWLPELEPSPPLPELTLSPFDESEEPESEELPESDGASLRSLTPSTLRTRAGRACAVGSTNNMAGPARMSLWKRSTGLPARGWVSLVTNTAIGPFRPSGMTQFSKAMVIEKGMPAARIWQDSVLGSRSLIPSEAKSSLAPDCAEHLRRDRPHHP